MFITILHNFILFLLVYFPVVINKCQLVATASINEIKNDVRDDIHLEMTDDELHSIFGSKKDVPAYEVIQLVRHPKTRNRRSRQPETQDSIDEVVGVPLKYKHIVLHLTRKDQLMVSPLRVEEIDADESVRVRYIMDHPTCLFHGKVAGSNHSSAAISTCGLREGEMTGVIHLTPNEPYLIKPVPERLLDPDQVAHIVYKRNDDNNYQCAHDNHLMRNPQHQPDNAQWTQRDRRETVQNMNKTIETAVFVDDVLYQKLQRENSKNVNEAVVNIVFTFINAVQLIYSQSSLTSHVNIVLVQVSVIKRASAGPSKRHGDIENYLESFCSWQSRRNPKGDLNSSHWDHALLLTGMDLYMGEPDNTVVIGLAWVSGMCRRQFSCSINEGTTFESVFVISHELGHNLGMQHDGEKNKNECSETDYIMSSSLGPGKTTWSTCSNDYLREFFRSPTSSCLNDLAVPKHELDHRSEYLPGQLFSATVQCYFSYGRKYKPYVTDEDPFDNVCRELWCANGTVARRAHPALDGTPCGPLLQCFHGNCTTKQKIRNELSASNLLPPKHIN